MRYLLALLIFGSAVYVVYKNVSLNRELAASRQELTKTKAELDKTKKSDNIDRVKSTARAVPQGRMITEKIVCTHCKGEGQYELTGSGGRIRYSTCPLCTGSGSHTLKMPNKPGIEICPSCKGMGRLIVTGIGLSRKGRVSTTIDRRCGGKGYL